MVDIKDRADQTRLALVVLKNGKRIKQAAIGKLIGLIAKILLVKIERGLIVKFVEDITIGLRDPPCWPERRPATLGSRADLDMLPIKADSDKGVLRNLANEKRMGFQKAGFIPGESPGDADL